MVSCSLLQAGSSHFLSKDYPISSIQDRSHTSTPPKINIEPENDGLEDDFPFKFALNLLNVMFQVNLPGCIQLFFKTLPDHKDKMWLNNTSKMQVRVFKHNHNIHHIKCIVDLTKGMISINSFLWGIQETTIVIGMIRPCSKSKKLMISKTLFKTFFGTGTKTNSNSTWESHRSKFSR